MDSEKIKMITVESSNIASVGYEDKDKTLYVRFKSGKIYSYDQVERALFEKLLKADSKGKFFNKEIKWEYPYQMVDIQFVEV